MPLFRYEALDRTGTKVVGAMQVSDEAALNARLTEMGYRATHVEIPHRSLTACRGATHASGSTASRLPARAYGAMPAASPITASERSIARLFHQLHIAFRAGMPAFQAISTVAGQIHERPLQQMLSEVSLGVRDGNRISDLMEHYPRLFSRGDVGTVRAAEMGGFLPEALESIAKRYEEDDNTRRRLRVWVWFFHSNVLVFFCLFALAPFFAAAIRAGFDARVGLMAVGRAFLTVTLPLSLLYYGALTAFYFGRRNPGLAYRWHRMLLRLPVVGRINFLRSNAVFTRTLQQLYSAGVMPASAWETAAAAVPNYVLSDRFSSGQPVVESTGTFSIAMQQVDLLQPTDVGMVAMGEASGEIAEALNYLANHYEEDTRVALGETVVRGAVTFTLWAFLLGALGVAVVAWGYAQGLNAIDPLFDQP